MKRVTAKDAKQLQDEGWTYVDVRTEGEFEGGHPTGSININCSAPNFLDVIKQRFKPDAKLIIGCQMGGRSARAGAALEAQGYTSLADNTQGFGGWTQEKLPVAKGKS
jgi:rhodanese-related sulfurtransferase